MTFSEKVISFIKGLDYKGTLPTGIAIMNPFMDNSFIIPVVSQFYSRFYNDNLSRHLILGINPGRFGAGSTGIPFTDTKRLTENCGITIPGLKTYEPSAAFIYEMIEAFGGTEEFYSYFYISAVSPLGFTTFGRNGKQVNFNYYDSTELEAAVYEFIKTTIEQQLEFGIARDVCFCLGTSKNFRFIIELNKRFGYFEKIIPLEHPRFIMQYKLKQKQIYIAKYVQEFRNCITDKKVKVS